MPEKVYVETPWEYLSAYQNGQSYYFLYYKGKAEELPVYLAQKSADAPCAGLCVPLVVAAPGGSEPPRSAPRIEGRVVA